MSVFIPIPQKGKAKECSDYLAPEKPVCKSRINRTNMEQPDGQEQVRNSLTLILGKTEGRRRSGQLGKYESANFRGSYHKCFIS